MSSEDIERVRQLIREELQALGVVAIEPASGVEWQKCLTCQSTGKRISTGEYCQCQLGRDLQRVDGRRRVVGEEPFENTWESTQV